MKPGCLKDEKEIEEKINTRLKICGMKYTQESREISLGSEISFDVQIQKL